MKILLYVIAALLVIIWAILIIGFKTTASVHFILVFALIVLIFTMLFGKKLSRK